MRMLALLIGLGAGSAASAQTVTYDCRMGSGRGTGWVMNQYIFQVDKAALKATVTDPMINQFVGQPITTDLDLRSNGNMIIKWELPNVPSSLGDRLVRYEAFINASNGNSWVEGSIAGSPFFAQPRRNGRCAGG